MKERRFTMDRRTFIKTSGGLVIMKAFSGHLAPAHAATPPAALEFKSSVARWLAIDQSGALDSDQQGRITVTTDGRGSTSYPIQNGSMNFFIPNNTPSEILLEVDNMTPRAWGAEFDNGILVLKNHDFSDTLLVYHWMDLDNAYVLEYWQEDLYVTGPADPGGYYIGWLYAPLEPLKSAGRLPPISRDEDDDGPPPDGPPPYVPPQPGQGPSTGQNGSIGTPDSNVGVSTGSTPDDTAGSYEEDDNGCCSCGGSNSNKEPMEGQAEMTIPSEEIRIPIIPSLAALQQKQLNPQLDSLDFGAVLKLDDPSGNDMGAVFVGLNEEKEIAAGVMASFTHILTYPIDQVAINSTWPEDLLKGATPGAYKITFWAQTTDGLISNKRFEYFGI